MTHVNDLSLANTQDILNQILSDIKEELTVSKVKRKIPIHENSCGGKRRRNIYKYGRLQYIIEEVN